MRNLILSLSLILSASLASANGITIRGGGDTCEEKIKAVRNDIKSWIERYAGFDLQLPSNLNAYTYSQEMLRSIASTKVKCVSQGDEGYPVQIEGTPKVCRFDIDNVNIITCDAKKFQALKTEEQYSLVHHEYAGLAQLEIPNRDDSNYQISEQIPRFLKEMRVQRLTFGSATDQVILKCQDNFNILDITLNENNQLTIQRTVQGSSEVFYIGGDFNDPHRVIIKNSTDITSKVVFENPTLKRTASALTIEFKDAAKSSLQVRIDKNGQGETLVTASSANKELAKAFIKALGFESSRLLKLEKDFICTFNK